MKIDNLGRTQNAHTAFTIKDPISEKTIANVYLHVDDAFFETCECPPVFLKALIDDIQSLIVQTLSIHNCLIADSLTDVWNLAQHDLTQYFADDVDVEKIDKGIAALVDKSQGNNDFKHISLSLDRGISCVRETLLVVETENDPH